MNYGILIIGFTFYYLQNTYFGFNRFPESDVELIADGLTLLIFSLAFIRNKVEVEVKQVVAEQVKPDILIHK